MLVLLLVSVCSSAAAQYFNVRIDPYGQLYGEVAFSVESTSDGNYAVFVGAPFNNGQEFYSSVVTSIVVDEQGEVLSVDGALDTLHATYAGWSNSSAQRADGGFVVGGGDFRSDSAGNWIQRAVLYFFDGNGLFEQMVPVGPDGQEWIGRQAKQTPDGGYVICGETSSNGGNQLDAFVIKTDAQGNEDWTRTYGGAWNDFINSVDHFGTAYYTGGNNRISSGNAQFWVQCLNDTGGVVWEKLWGGPFPESTANISVAQNGDVLVAGGWAYSNFAMARRYLARLDPSDGSFIWQGEYGAQVSDCALQTVKEVPPSMDLISVGSMSQGGYHGTLFRTTSAGDSLWMRHYQYHDSLVSNGRGILRDVVPTPDGGFVAVGSALSVPGVYTQDVWVIKVDEYGCLEPGCHLITGMETQITNLGGALKVWPNPVAAGTPVQVDVQLPEGFAVQGALRLTVTDAAGRIVREEYFTTHTSALTLHTSLPSGLYHLHLTDNTRWIAGAKLVVE